MDITKYKYILFDLDDTLLDFQKAQKLAFKKLLKNYNIDYSEELYSVYNTMNKEFWKKFELGEITSEELKSARFEKFFSHIGKSISGKECDEEYRKYLAMGDQLFKGVTVILEKLSKSHVLCVATNGIALTQKTRLKNNDLNKYFSNIFISEEIGYKKPDKEFFDHIFKQLKIKDKSEVIIIGDTLSSDILGGKNSGIATCWINSKKLPIDKNIEPTYILESVNDIL